MDAYYSSERIIRQINRVETPQQNGLVERKHQHIINNIARSLLFQQGIIIISL